MIIGIDLGTTNSLAAYFTEDGPRIIPNRLGRHLTPSVVSVDENDQVFVGETAKERGFLYPQMTASVFKRDMGSDRKYRLGARDFTAQDLSSFVLRSLKEDAEAFLQETVEEAVILSLIHIFRRHTGISGCSIMGNGKICAALDIEILIEKFTKEAVHERE